MSTALVMTFNFIMIAYNVASEHLNVIAALMLTGRSTSLLLVYLCNKKHTRVRLQNRK